MSRRYRDPDFLYEQYVEAGKSMATIGEMCGVAPNTISRWLDRHDIEHKPRYQREEWLRTQYVEHSLDQIQIAERCDVAKSTICLWLARHGITDGASLETATCETCGDEFRYYPSVRDGQYCSNDCARVPDKRQVEITCPGCESTFHRRASLDTEYCSMACWSEDYDGHSRKWYRGKWWRQRQKARERDSYKCTVCGMTDEEHQRRCGQELDVHHIVPIRLFDRWDKPIADAHELRNLTTVCRTHHPDAPGTTEMLDPNHKEKKTAEK